MHENHEKVTETEGGRFIRWCWTVARSLLLRLLGKPKEPVTCMQRDSQSLHAAMRQWFLLTRAQEYGRLRPPLRYSHG